MTVFPTMTGKESQHGEGWTPTRFWLGEYSMMVRFPAYNGRWKNRFLWNTWFRRFQIRNLTWKTCWVLRGCQWGNLLRASQIKEMGQTFANWTEAGYKSTMKSSKPTKKVNQFRESHSKVCIRDFRESISNIQNMAQTILSPQDHTPPKPKKKRGPFRYF